MLYRLKQQICLVDGLNFEDCSNKWKIFFYCLGLFNTFFTAKLWQKLAFQNSLLTAMLWE